MINQDSSSGWVTVATSPSVAVSRYMVRGGYVTYQVDGSATTVSGTVLTLAASGIPAELRPSVTVRGHAYCGGHPGTLTITTGGAVQVVQQSGASRSSVAGLLAWPVESP